jgi:hypothetical protein
MTTPAIAASQAVSPWLPASPPAPAGSPRRPTVTDANTVRPQRRPVVCRRLTSGGGGTPMDDHKPGPAERRATIPTTATDWASGPPEDLDLDRPNVARVYDYLLGGAHNFHADRAAAEQALASAPQIGDAARANRAFLRRAVQHALDNGVRQFLDLGSGIPNVGNVHEIVHAVDPHAPVLYVDRDPVVAAHTRAQLGDTDMAGIIQADIRDTTAILGHPETTRLIDLNRPVAVLLVYLLHFLPGDVTGLIAALRRPLAPGSHLVITHATPTADGDTTAVQELYARTPTPLQLRSREEIRALFTGFDLVHPDPGSTTPADLVPVTRWRPEPTDTPPSAEIADNPYITGLLAAAARKPPTAGGNWRGATVSTIRPSGISPRGAIARDVIAAYREATTATQAAAAVTGAAAGPAS